MVDGGAALTHTVDSLMALAASYASAIEKVCYAPHEFESALRALAALRTALEEALAQRWLPIETAPKDGGYLLVFDGDTEAPQRWIVSWAEFEGDPDGGSWLTSELATIAGPTLWMPLPEPAKEPA